MENLKRVRPTRFLGVPRVWEKIAEKMQEVGKSNKGLKKALGNYAKKSATKYHSIIREKGYTSPLSDEYIHYKIAKKLILRYLPITHQN